MTDQQHKALSSDKATAKTTRYTQSLIDLIKHGESGNLPIARLLTTLSAADPDQLAYLRTRHKDVLDAVIWSKSVDAFLLLERAGAFTLALEEQSHDYLMIARKYFVEMMRFGNGVSPEKMIKLFPSAKSVDIGGASGANINIWEYLVNTNLPAHIDAMLTRKLHLGSDSFSQDNLVYKVIQGDSVDLLKVMNKHRLNLHMVKFRDGHTYRATEIALLYSSPGCLDYLFTLNNEGYDDDSYGFPIQFAAEGEPCTVEILQVLHRHAKRFGIDLNTFRDPDGKTLRENLLDAGGDYEEAYLEFQRLTQAENAAESVKGGTAVTQRPKI